MTDVSISPFLNVTGVGWGGAKFILDIVDQPGTTYEQWRFNQIEDPPPTLALSDWQRELVGSISGATFDARLTPDVTGAILYGTPNIDPIRYGNWYAEDGTLIKSTDAPAIGSRTTAGARRFAQIGMVPSFSYFGQDYLMEGTGATGHSATMTINSNNAFTENHTVNTDGVKTLATLAGEMVSSINGGSAATASINSGASFRVKQATDGIPLLITTSQTSFIVLRITKQAIPTIVSGPTDPGWVLNDEV